MRGKQARQARAVATLFGFGTAAFAQEARTTQAVKDGDRPGEIASAAHGSCDHRQIFDANRDIIATSPHRLAPGTRLSLPWPDGRSRPESEPSSVTGRASGEFGENRQATSEYAPPFRLVAGDGPRA